MKKFVSVAMVCACLCAPFTGVFGNVEKTPAVATETPLQTAPVEVTTADLEVTGATLTAETLSFVDAASDETVEGEFIKIEQTEETARFKIRGLFDEYDYAERVEIQFSLYYVAEDYRDVAVLDETDAPVAETMLSGALTTVWCNAHVFTDGNGKFAKFSIENFGSSFVYLKDFTVNAYVEEVGEMFGGATVYQIPSSLGLGSMGYFITTANGKNIMIDGGNPQDAPDVLNVLHRNGCVIDAWFLSHPHDDHICSLTEILKNNPEIKVKSLYYNFPDVSWIAEKEIAAVSYVNEFLDTVESLDINVVTIHGGDEYTFDGVTFKVINDLQLFDYNSINEANMVIKMVTSGKDILFLGDTGWLLSPYLLEHHRDELKAEVVQMAHHGQNGATFELYQAVAPEICLWPTPEWVWNAGYSGDLPNSVSNLATYQVRYWMNKLGVKQHYISKDGLIVLK